MSYKHLLKSDRLEISILLQKGYSYREIGKSIGKSASAISREISEHSTKGVYDPIRAHYKALLKRNMSKYQGMKIEKDVGLQNYVETRLKDGWTPEEIAGKLKTDNGGKNIISGKSIYKYLYSTHGQYLCKYLMHKQYKPKKQTGATKKKELIPNRVPIEQRPLAVTERARFGDMEGDTLGRIKSDSDVIVGVRERLSRKLFICKMPGLKYTMDGFKLMLNPHHDLIKSLTLDNGVENVKWATLNIPTYFCNPYSSWEKGGIENDFKRLRRWIPKKSSIAKYTADEISVIMEKMNNTPRKCLGYKTPNQVWDENVQLFNSPSVALEGKI